MTEINSQADVASEIILGKAHKQYAELTTALLVAAKELKDSDNADMQALATLVRGHWKAFQTLFDMEIDLEKRRRERAGIVHGYAIDLESAGLEIGRRLARLRSAAGTGKVSGGHD